MSFQAGIIYLDGRPVPECEEAAVLGWVRSSDDSAPAGHRQPGVFLAPCREEHPLNIPPGCAITFDGRLDHREDLPADAPADANDAALALYAYERWGVDGLAHLVGDWSLAIWDGPRRTIVLASDFAGVRPLYYSIQQNRVVWSTRLQPLIDWAGRRRH